MFIRVIPFILLLLAGCAAQKTAFVPSHDSDKKGSVVYVYRASKISSVMLAPTINMKTIGGEQTKIGKLSHGEYKLLYLRPGKYEAEIESIEHYTPGNTLMLEVKPYTVNYLRLNSTLKFEMGTRYKSFERKFDIQAVEELIALSELASCTDIDSKPKKKNSSANIEAGSATEGVSTKNDDAYFSTDKTADPFSRNR